MKNYLKITEKITIFAAKLMNKTSRCLGNRANLK